MSYTYVDDNGDILHMKVNESVRTRLSGVYKVLSADYLLVTQEVRINANLI